MSYRVRVLGCLCVFHVAVLCSPATAASTDLTCKQTLSDVNATAPRKMSAEEGAAFLKTCEDQARRTCKHEGKQLKLDAHVLTDHIQKCTKAKVG